MKKKILLVDGNALIFRAFYSQYGRTPLSTKAGIPTNAAYSFINMICNIAAEHQYFDIKVAFDKGKKTFRHEKLETYKAGRQKTPPELVAQFPIVREFLTEAKIDWFELDNYEADDIIGTISNKLKNDENYIVHILSNDQDMYQLIGDNVFVLSPKTGTSSLFVYDQEKLVEKWGIYPQQVTDYKGLRGDSSDNIKGVLGIGEKTAKELLQTYKNLDDIYQNIDDIKGSKQAKLLEGKEDAYLSKEIATIKLDIELNNFHIRKTDIDFDNLRAFFIKYEMNSLIKKLCSEEVKNPEVLEYQILTKWNPSYSDAINYIYLETLDQNYHNSEVIGMGIVNSKGNFFYIFGESEEINIFNWQEDKYDEDFRSFLKKNKFKTYDIKKTIYALNNLGYDAQVDNFIYDMMLACYVLNPNVKSNFESHLMMINPEIQIESSDEIFGKGVKRSKNIDKDIKAKYLVTKASHIKETENKIIHTLEELEQLRLYENIELPFSKVLLSMEQEGVLIDREELKKQTEEVLLLLNKIEAEVKEELKDYISEDFNLASPKQLKEVLFDKMKIRNSNKGSTDKEALTDLINEHPVVEKILIYRKYSKLYSTYLKGFGKFVHENNKVHTIFNQTLTNTGRLSSSDPNLQNISIRDEEQKNVRKIFICKPGYKYISYDYSQIELRVLADVANEPTLIKAYANNLDIHELAARNIFNINADDKVTADQRRVAKVFNFGILYGLTDYGLSKDLKIPLKDAKEYIQKYNESFSEVDNFKKNTLEFAMEHGYVKTMANRRRYILELKNSNHMIREFGKRAAINAPIQGTAADILKMAMIGVFNDLNGLDVDAKMVAQIHDEIIILAREETIDTVNQIVIRNMKEAYNNILELANHKRISLVPLDVNYSIGNNWYELK